MIAPPQRIVIVMDSFFKYDTTVYLCSQMLRPSMLLSFFSCVTVRDAIIVSCDAMILQIDQGLDNIPDYANILVKLSNSSPVSGNVAALR
jgi:hypothetical protein